MELRIFQVDAFTTELFTGNPAAVVPLEEWLDDTLMQSIAAENNLSETAFFVRTGADDDHWHIRWFTPVIEVPLCGHATLASAAVIARYFAPSSWPITLESASGALMVDTEDDAYILDFPANEASECPMPDDLAAALGTAGRECLYTDGFYLVTVACEADLAGISPNFEAIAAFTNDSVIVTARGDSTDFVSRFFAPGLGIEEDPVTGAAHCVLTPYWSGRLDKTLLQARQISARGGELGCELRGERVRIRGRVAFYLEGQLMI